MEYMELWMKYEEIKDRLGAEELLEALSLSLSTDILEDRKQIEKQLDNMKNNIDDYDNLDEEQKNRIIRECVRKVEVENDVLSKRGRIIEIYMIDGTKHTIHMTKRNHDFITNIIYKDKETRVEDLEIKKRFKAR